MCNLQQYVIHVVLIIFSSNIVQTNACNCSRNEHFSNHTCFYCICTTEEDISGRSNCSYTLTMKLHNVKILKSSHLEGFNENMIDIQLTEFWNLNSIEKDALNRFSKLKSFSISRAPILVKLSLDILEMKTNSLRTIEITKTGLKYIPRIRSTGLLETINLEENSIQKIEQNNFLINAGELSLEYNKLETIESWAFNNSRISKISLKGNWHLQNLPEETFYGLDGLKTLDLSETSISRIPATGLEMLEELRIIGTKSMKTIPSIYYFKYLAKAELTFSFHCCAFTFYKRHDPTKYARFSLLSEVIEPLCGEYKKQIDNETMINNEDEEWHDGPVTPSNSFNSTIELQKHTSISLLAATISKEQAVAFCNSYRFRNKPVDCTPIPDAFNPCEDIMGYKWLRICVWLVVLIGLMGNASVLVINTSKLHEITVQNLLILNLAFADICMVVFLLLLAVQDLISKDNYFNYAYDWQYGAGCKCAGFLTIFSSQLSIFTLCFITIERWFTIKKALYLHKLSFQKTLYFAGCGWIYSLLMATLPLLGISSYSTTSLCLPMDIGTSKAKAYVLFLLSVAMLAFIIICICYYQIYFSLNEETRHKDGEYVLARKMTILVGTNFISWTPITFFALTAFFNYPLINITNSKILMVFFYPLNSCANPFLYAILTTNFRRNFIFLLSRFGFCKESARAYKLIYCQPVNVHNIHRPITEESSV